MVLGNTSTFQSNLAKANVASRSACLSTFIYRHIRLLEEEKCVTVRKAISKVKFLSGWLSGWVSSIPTKPSKKLQNSNSGVSFMIPSFGRRQKSKTVVIQQTCGTANRVMPTD